MKRLTHPATIIAAVALFIALGGGAVAYAAGVINGSQIKNHSIAKKKLTKKAIKQLHGLRGKTGATGAPGATGPQGPGGKIVTFDATATTSAPTATALGTFLGMTLSAACSTTAGNAKLILNINTSDGSWNTDVGQIISPGSSSSAAHISIPAGTISSPTPLTLTAASGGNTNADWLSFVQIGPQTGSVVWNLSATTTTTKSCHFSIQYFPETITALHGAAHATTKLSQLPHLLGLR